jgi:integrase
LKTVQAMLGHSTIVTTADIHTSALPELQRDAAAAIAALVLAAGRSTTPTSDV